MEDINNFDFEKNFSLENLQKLRAHYAGFKRDVHPRMFPFLEKVHRRNLYVFKLEKTLEKLEAMTKKIQEIEKANKKILFVCSNKKVINFLEKYIKGTQHFYIDNRWLGGILTNFDHLQKRIVLLQEMYKKEKKGTIDFLTKKERLHFQRKKNALEINLKGILEMKTLPDYVFVVNPFFQKIAFQEAKKKNIPILALCRANVNPEDFEEFIPINDNSFEILNLFFCYLKNDVLKQKSVVTNIKISNQNEINKNENENDLINSSSSENKEKNKVIESVREKIIQELENKNE